MAAAEYRRIHGLYVDLADGIRSILRQSFQANHLKVHSIEARAKSVESFEKKASKEAEDGSEDPRYSQPLQQITDLAGIRVIAFLPRDVERACEVIAREFQILERTDKSEALIDEGRFGYQSVHFLARLSGSRSQLAEYSRFAGRVFEIQVRTILQHAWAEMEHDIQYKSGYAIPNGIKKRFIALAGMLEIADREFQRLQDDDEALREVARTSVQSGNYLEVEITGDALKAYLDKKLGPDGRITDFSYEMVAGHLKRLGFTTIQQIDDCISPANGDQISVVLWGSRQGQLTRFEGMVLSQMGNLYVARHPWAADDYWAMRFPQHLEKLREHGIAVGSYDPVVTGESAG
jgi:ppGpp synthetase/RelA/SpoT-type nucleotidyltranferase